MPHRIWRHNRATNTGIDGHVSAPKASHVEEVLVTLRDRLQAQLENGEESNPVMVRDLHDNMRGQLEQIKEALVRIEEGKYGICARCHAMIEADRMLARPYSTLCSGCHDTLAKGRLERN